MTLGVRFNILALALLVLATSAWGADLESVPKTIAFQGFLTDSSSVPITNPRRVRCEH